MKNKEMILVSFLIMIQMIFGVNYIKAETERRNLCKGVYHRYGIKEIENQFRGIRKKQLKEQADKEAKIKKEIEQIKEKTKKEKMVVLEKNYREEQIKIEKKKKEQSGTISRGGSVSTFNGSQTLVLTFYTSLACENGGWENITTSGKALTSGFVASGSSIPLGTTYETEYGRFVVEDRMSEAHANDSRGTRLDVFVDRQSGESDEEYKRRVNNMGVKVVKANLIKWGR